MMTPNEKEQEQTGRLITPATLPVLSADQLQALQLAKRYCQDISSKFQQQKQALQQVNQMAVLQEAANRQRALLLMSRIYIGSINFELGEESVRLAFEPFGTIKALNMSWDSATMKHKGYSFIEYETAEAAQLALEQMNGVVMGGRNIKVGRPNNVPQAAPVIAAIQEEASRIPRIYVTSIHLDLSSQDVKSVFEAFGKITKVDLAPSNVADKHRGWGFVNYAAHKSAKDAIASMNLFDLGGQFLRVRGALTPPMQLYPPNAAPVLPTILTTPFGTVDEQNAAALQAASSMPILNTIPNIPEPAPKPEPPSADAAATGAVVDTKNLDAIQAKLQAAQEEKQTGQEVTTLQQEESVSISGSNARLMIMKKLSRKSESSVVVLRNMVDAEDLDEELEEEVTGECSRFGTVKRVIIYQEKQGVEEDAETIVKIFVMFSNPSEAEAAISSLNGRWFGGKMIKAQIYDQAKFEANELSQ